MELIMLLPLWYQYTLVVLLGLIIGSFLNVYIYRFHTGKSLAGSSHCLSCGTPLRWFELFPVVSYVVLRGRCRSCGSYIPARYLLVEILTASVFIVLFSVSSLNLLFVLWLVLASILVVIVVYDLYHLIIPNELVLAVSAVALLMYGVANQWSLSLLLLMPHLWAALGAFLFYGSLWFVSKGRWIGFGDVKLSIPLAFWLGAWQTFSFVILSFWVGAGISVVLLLLQRLLKRGQHRLSKYGIAITMKSEVPFAPFLILAFLMVALFHTNVLVLIDELLPL